MVVKVIGLTRVIIIVFSAIGYSSYFNEGRDNLHEPRAFRAQPTNAR